MSGKAFNPTLLLLCLMTAAPAHAGTDVTLSEEQIQNLEIKVEKVRPAEAEVVAVLPGTVIPPPNSRLVATAPFAGTVTQVLVLPGQRVSKGAPLATVSSRELLEAQSQLSQAEAELQMADAIARRKRDLANKNFQSPLLADEAEAQVAKIKAVIAQHRRTLSLHAITIGDGGIYTLPAPADGTVVESAAAPGEKIDAMAPAVTLDTSDAVWVEAQVPAALVSEIKRGDLVEVPGGPAGRVASLGASLHGASRSAMLYAEFPPGSSLLAGQLVSLTLKRTTEKGAMTVPASAVARISDQSAVFVRNGGGFQLKPIVLRGQSTEVATIVGDLAADAEVAASGLPQLEQMLAGE